ncbi:H-NS histone family protein [Immundisolibacter sp.]|jgi:DNA-binding protein H-NS|uniref:H-NS histone family protein n=1 Tax=Immundisolibacter sp. TaxID=1934948 RepID=UPI002605C084|nr:H-NS histone family protein [Immundisolibacter sp.]MDD3652140.1 H-NS histone family protein [Immundisolibacter sp.]
MPNINLSNFSLDELQHLIAEAESTLEKRQREQRAEVIAQMRKLAASVGIDFEIIAPESRKRATRTTAAAKYRNPANPAQTWNGRGPKPKWFKEALAAGKTPEQLAV